MQMDITNCNSVALKGLDGIMQMENTENDTPQYFTTDGKKANAADMKKGIYIVKQGGKNRKVVIK